MIKNSRPSRPDRINEIVAALNSYQGGDIWQDIILQLPEYDSIKTAKVERYMIRSGYGPGDVFVLNDDAVFDRRNFGLWQCLAIIS